MQDSSFSRPEEKGVLKLLHRFGVAETAYGADGMYPDPYLTHIVMTPKTRWGWLQLHIFWRGDNDPHCHDHMFDFWTLPFTSYREVVIENGEEFLQTVKAWRIHKRHHTYTHMVVDRADKEPKPFITLIWRTPRKRNEWFFHIWNEGRWLLIPWREYIFEGRRS